MPSNVLGKFKLIAELGRGGMSEVYLAVVAGPAGFNKLMVIKLIKAELAEDPDFINMFLEEARLSARLSHPNIVQTNEVGEAGGRFYIAMEYLEGQPYSRILHRLGRDRGLPLGMSLRILGDVLGGLQYAHDLTDFDGTALGVVHRDVTPHNVFVTYDGQVKVVDFGIAKAMNSSHETRTGMLKGKVGYMAPEQAKGERVDRRADIFSVGVMLWEAAVGRRLWKGMNEVQILHQLLAGDIPSPRSMRPDISQRLEAIIMKSLAPDRDRRHASAIELQAELEELMDSGSERSTLREVGRLLSATFDDERKKLKGIVEQQVARSNMMMTGAYQQVSLPNIEHPNSMTGELARASGFGLSATGSIPQFSRSGVSASGSHSIIPLAQGSSPSITGLPRLAPGTTGSEPGHSSQPSVSSSLAHAGVAHSPPGKPAPNSSKRLTMVALGIAAAAGGLAALLWVGFGRNSAASTPSSTPAAETGAPTATATAAADAKAAPTTTATASTAVAATASVSAAPGEIAVSVKVEPKDADVYIDGKKVGAGKVQTSIKNDGTTHEIKVDASGYTPKVRKIEPTETSVNWEPELAVDRHGTGVATTPTTPKTSTPPTADPPATSTTPGRDKFGKPIRTIDTAYPGG
ncbi:MAG: serine/threonine-protein kinase [Polyangiaceae bacterium]